MIRMIRVLPIEANVFSDFLGERYFHYCSLLTPNAKADHRCSFVNITRTFNDISQHNQGSWEEPEHGDTPHSPSSWSRFLKQDMGKDNDSVGRTICGSGSTGEWVFSTWKSR